MKILIVGEQPSKTGDPEKPIEGHIGARLAACANLTMDQYLTRFDRMNLLRVRAEYSGHGVDWNATKARERAEFIRTVIAPQYRVVLVLGRRAASAIGLVNEYFQECRVGRTSYYAVPHPSGLNRWWNDPENEKKMYDFMQWLLIEVEAETA